MSATTDYKGYHNVSLAYSFPAYKEEAKLKGVPRDANLTKNLSFDTKSFSSSHWFTGDPLTKKFKKEDLTSASPVDPLDGILAESRQAMSLYVVSLPYADKPKNQDQKKKESTPRTPSKVSKPTAVPLSASKKRIRQDLGETSPAYPQHSGINKSSTNRTPIPNKTIFFSPSGSAKKQASNVTQSTPISVLKEAQLNFRKSNQNLNRHLKTVGAEKAEKAEVVKQQDAVDDSDYDHLACHADNILRMAVDSTMLGSSFNGSFSSTFFAGGADDSIAALTRKDDIFHDDDADKSLLEGLKNRWNSRTLAKLRATKIEINADDLNKAVNDL